MTNKGISPLIAAVLLIAFTVALSTIIMGWMSSMTRETTTSVSGKVGSTLDCSNAAVSIKHIYISNGTGTNDANVTISIANSGYYAIQTTGAFYKSDGTSCVNTTQTNLTTGQVGKIIIHNCPNTNTATFGSVIVNTQCGGVYDETDYDSNLVTYG